LKISQITRIITHMHGDHVFGLIGLLATCGLLAILTESIYGSPKLDEYLRACSVTLKPIFTNPVHTPCPVCSTNEEFTIIRASSYDLCYRVAEKDRPGRFDIEKRRRF